jgi:uncharacterized protein YdeI (YjbR/CyaY-like superfamily)
MRFKKTETIAKQPKPVVEKKIAVKGIDFEKKLVMPPVELEKVFTKHKKAKEIFTALSVSNQKEYVSWIEQAKKEETRQRRLEVIVEKLMAGKKNPSEK